MEAIAPAKSRLRDSPKFARQIFWFLGISLVLHLITAIYSVGFFSWDEHFQTFEFLSPRLGRGPVSALPWEYAHAARPWLQPFLYYGVIRFLQFFGVQNAAVWSGAVRVLSGILSWSALVALVVCSKRWFTQESGARLKAVALAAFLCFIPFLDVRTSSENLSAAIFFLGLAAYFLAGTSFRRVLFAGVLMGLSLQFRYQGAFMVLGFLGFLCVVEKKWREAAWLVGWIALVSFAGVGVDSLGYGHWVFVPWNYFRVNLIEGRANAFSRDPIWFYFVKYIELVPPIGALCLAGVILGWVRKPRHVLTWVTLPLFLVSCLIRHKETRFLFPLVPAAPFLIAMGLEGFSEGMIQRAWRLARWILVPVNSVLLLVFMFKPAYSPFLLYGFVGSHPEIRKIVYRDENPFVQIRALQTNFFKPPGVALRQIPSYPALEDELQREGQFWLFEGSFQLPSEAGALQQQCEVRFSAFPLWLNRLAATPLAPILRIPGIKFANRRSLFFCKK